MAETIKRVEIKGRRFYQVKQGRKIIGTFPSVTTVLGGTSDQSGLDAWRKRVGEAEADRISTLSMNRGTVMHRLIELYKPMIGTKEERLSQLRAILYKDREIKKFDTEFIEQGLIFFLKFWNNHDQFFDKIAEVLAAERFLWSTKGGGFAGTVDNVSRLIDDKIIIIDYKNSRKPKRDDWIQDYYVQASAYFVAFWERTGIRPTGAQIWIANEIDECPQIFTLTEQDVKYYFSEFSKRLLKFNQEIENI
jgi:hypothetical protein